MKGRPLFIVFEGIDGSGKSTQCDLLHRHALSLGLDALRCAEPTEGPRGREIRAMLRKKEMAPPEEQHRLFLLDRIDDAERRIIPALREGKIVIMDRYYHSNAAYQGAAGMAPERVIAENRAAGVPEPDRVYFIDIPPGIAMKRIALRNTGEGDIFEKERFLEKVREIFLSIADGRFIAIDGRGGVEEIFDEVRRDFDEMIPAYRG
ncbi:MAG: dTMP kinase [Spirochaetes bacterium]|nr:dTMP kinase [Spirochaetota bacterium]